MKKQACVKAAVLILLATPVGLLFEGHLYLGQDMKVVCPESEVHCHLQCQMNPLAYHKAGHAITMFLVYLAQLVTLAIPDFAQARWSRFEFARCFFPRFFPSLNLK